MGDEIKTNVKSVLASEQGARRRRRWLLVIGGTLLLVGVGLAWTTGKLAGGDPAPRYQTKPVTRGDLQITVTATGTLQAKNTVDVGAEVSGRLIEVAVDFNDQVEAGQVLARVDPLPFEQEVTQAQARLQSARASLADARASAAEAAANRRRAEALWAEGLISSQDLDSSRASATRGEAASASAEAKVAEAAASLSASTTRQGKSTIRSPIAGIVLDRKVAAGQTVTAGFQTPVLFSLAKDLGEMELTADVDEADVGRLAEGQAATFTVDAYPGRVFSSRVLSIRNVPVTAQNVVTYQTVLAVENAGRVLRPGMTATVTIITTQVKDAVLVPNAALRFKPLGAAGEGPPSGGGARSGGGGRPSMPFMMGPPPGQQRKASPVKPAEPGMGVVWTLGPDGAPASHRIRKGDTDGDRTVMTEGDLQPGMELLTEVLEGPAAAGGSAPVAR